MDAIFKALSDPVRRAMLDSLRDTDGQTLTDLEAQFDMTRFGVMKHLKVLEEAHLVIPRKVGRFKHHYLNAVPLQEALDHWIKPYKSVTRSLLDLKSKLETDMTQKPDFMAQTHIRCTQDALWEALIDAETCAAYNPFASRAKRDGNTLVYYSADGGKMLVCTETELTPKTRIDATFEPHWAGPETDLDTSRFTYLIEPQGALCMLTVEHYSIPEGQDGIADGWSRLVASLKSLLETGEPLAFSYKEAAE